MRAMAHKAGLTVAVDSAGTGAWHLGDPPDPRGLKVAAARGYDNGAQRARQVTAEDFRLFDLIVAMDRRNLADLEGLKPTGSMAEIRLFHPHGVEIPDPYHQDVAAYEHALDLVEEASRALIEQLAASPRPT